MTPIGSPGAMEGPSGALSHPWKVIRCMTDFECVVVGAGVIGVAVARALALAGREVLILEAGPAIGGETSSRSSEVIHAGLYYPTGSLKHRLCLEGRDALYRFCAERGVPHHRL